MVRNKSMKASIRNWTIAIGGAAYLGISYVVTTSPAPSLTAIVLSLIPLGAAAAIGIWKSRARAFKLVLFLAALVLIALNIDKLSGHIAWLYFLQHVGAMTLLAVVFGNTLRAGHADALCSRIAILIIPVELSPGYLHYTWKVTFAWTCYFAICAVLSVVLFFFTPIQVWSVFSILITPISIGMMFVGEYLIRQRVLPEGPQVSIATIIQTYRRMS